MVAKIKNILKITILLIVLAVIAHRSPITVFAQTDKFVRVAVVQDASFLSLKINGTYEIIEPNSKEVLYRGKNLRTTVTAYKNGILLGGRSYRFTKVMIRKEDPSDTIVINGRTYRGSIQFIKRNNLRLMVVNFIDMEDYIKGILYHEVSHYWPQEALKAQAIVCRTYAYYQMVEKASKDYDVTSDIYSQVYGGRVSERSRTNRAVEESKGYVLTYQGKI
ncbi:MAG: SpoIID/LytB domain-containing protein, partial [Candidatus Omnitrophota bacterium]